MSSLLLVNIVFDIINSAFLQKGLKATIFIESTNTVFALVEISSFLYLFKQILNVKFIKQLIIILWVIFLILFFVFFLKMTEVGLTRNQIKKISYAVNIIEFLILLPLCLLYFYHLLIKEQHKLIHLNDSPSFWIISGLFFYCSVSLPFLFIGDTFSTRSRNLYYLMGSIHYTSISLLFLCLAKAFSCKKALTI